MAWSLGSIVIHPDDRQYSRSKTSNYSRQHPLDAVVDTIGYFGANSVEIELAFILDDSINGGNGLATLEGLVDANSNVALVGDVGSLGNVRILSLQASRVQALAHSDEVWDCVAQLVKV